MISLLKIWKEVKLKIALVIGGRKGEVKEKEGEGVRQIDKLVGMCLEQKKAVSILTSSKEVNHFELFFFVPVDPIYLCLTMLSATTLQAYTNGWLELGVSNEVAINKKNWKKKKMLL